MIYFVQMEFPCSTYVWKLNSLWIKLCKIGENQTHSKRVSKQVRCNSCRIFNYSPTGGSFLHTLFWVWGGEEMFQRGHRWETWWWGLRLCGLHAFSFFSGHRLKVGEGHEWQTWLIVLSVSTLGVWSQGLPAGLHWHWTWKNVTNCRTTSWRNSFIELKRQKESMRSKKEKVIS